MEYVDAIEEDVKWLGFQWDKRLWASDYFDKMYEFAVRLIKKGSAFVCDLNADQIREYRGTLKEPGKESPYRNRSVEENLKLFEEMKEGKYKDGEKVLRAKIDMASPNINMRDPVIYRISHTEHHNTGGKYCIYPMYDYAHPIEDAIESITHSICTLSLIHISKVFLCGILIDALWIALLWGGGVLLKASCSVKDVIGACGTANIFPAVILMIAAILLAVSPTVGLCAVLIAAAVAVVSMTTAAQVALELEENRRLYLIFAVTACYILLLLSLIHICNFEWRIPLRRSERRTETVP